MVLLKLNLVLISFKESQMVFYRKILMVVASAALCAQVVVASEKGPADESTPATPKMYTKRFSENYALPFTNWVVGHAPALVGPYLQNSTQTVEAIVGRSSPLIEWSGPKVERLATTAQPYVEGAWDRFKAAKERAAAIKFGIPSVHDASEWVLKCLKSVVVRLEDCKKEKKIEAKKE